MTAEKFKSICEYKGITWNDLVRIRIIRPKKFLGFFRQLTGITKENKDPELESINSFNDTVKKANEIKDRVLKYVDKIKQERAYNIDPCMTFERYIEIADKDAERAMAFLKEAYPFNEETEVFIRKRYNMSIDVDPEEN